eukprot:3516298-Pleurochrysis_carterae.AAC.2
MPVHCNLQFSQISTAILINIVELFHNSVIIKRRTAISTLTGHGEHAIVPGSYRSFRTQQRYSVASETRSALQTDSPRPPLPPGCANLRSISIYTPLERPNYSGSLFTHSDLSHA